MKALVTAGLMLAAAALAQAPPDSNAAQQEAYRHWRETDPNLERDATTAGGTLGARADKVAAEAAKYFSVRKDYLEGRAADARRAASLLDPADITPALLPNLDRFLTSQDTILKSTIETLARDPDRAIQQLRTSLERERAAITAVGVSLKDSQRSQEAAVQSSRTAEDLRAKALDDFQKAVASLQETERLSEQSGTAWAGYYRALSDAARAPAAPVTSSGPALPTVGREPAAVESAPPATANPAPTAVIVPHPVPPVPLVRYVGEWTYPTVGAHFHGMQPESAELVVREENGQGSGTLTARFKLPAGSADNPAVRFTFAGPFGSSRAQKFVVTTAGGATGTLELIPGPAFNLLEVNFSTEDKPGTIRQGNFLLIKR